MFIFIGVVLGYASHFFLKFHQHVNIWFRPYTSKYPLIFCVAVGVFTALIVFVTGAYNDHSVSVLSLVIDTLNNGESVFFLHDQFILLFTLFMYLTVMYVHVIFCTGSTVNMTKLGVPAFLGILVSIVSRLLLTMIGTNIPVPAG